MENDHSMTAAVNDRIVFVVFEVVSHLLGPPPEYLPYLEQLYEVFVWKDDALNV